MNAQAIRIGATIIESPMIQSTATPDLPKRPRTRRRQLIRRFHHRCYLAVKAARERPAAVMLGGRIVANHAFIEQIKAGLVNMSIGGRA